MRRNRCNGSALILVMVCSVVLSILAGALYTLFKANTDSQRYVEEMIQARYTAESGINRAIHMIMEGAAVPGGDQPLQMIPASGDWEFLGDELGWVQVWVDPHRNNDEVSNANAYEVRCLSKVLSDSQDYMYGIRTMILPRNFAIYAAFLNENDLNGYYADHYRFDGPFHCNETVILGSDSPGRNNDPYFYSFSVCEDHYWYYDGALTKADEPQIGSLWIEPYEKMVLGEPFFNLDADPIPFGPDEVNWEGARNAAISGGLHLPGLSDSTRLILKSDTLLIRENEFGPVTKVCLSDLTYRVVWIDNAPGEIVYLKTDPTPLGVHALPDTLGVTIGVNGDLAVSGPILYQNTDLMDSTNVGILGLITVKGNFLVACDPDISGDPEWADPYWGIATSHIDYSLGIQVHAVIMVLEKELGLEGYAGYAPPLHGWPDWPIPAVNLEILGGYIINKEGITGFALPAWLGGSSGYNTFVTYDPRLMTMHPPFFPQTGLWDTAYWEEVPDMTDDPLAGELFIGYNRI